MSGAGHYAVFVGLRYSFSRKRSRFTALIAAVSMLGMVLGVASLIAVLSVMNGFGAELRGRILSLVPHIYLEGDTAGIDNWQQLRSTVLAQKSVLGAAPFISDKVIFGSAYTLRGAAMTAIDPEFESTVSDIPASIIAGSLDDLAAQPYAVIMGASLARSLALNVGDQVEVTVPRLTLTPLGAFPRSKRLRLVGLFEIGAQADAYQAYVSLATGQALLSSGSRVDGLQLKTDDLYRAPQTAQTLRELLPPQYQLRDWSQSQGSLFQAIKMEKIMVSLLLLSVVAVAAFNVISTLVMSVAEKRRDIAVLRTMGAPASGIMAIFVAHGLGLAAVGISIGALLGVLIASYISPLSQIIERLLGVKLFDPSVYFISELPSVLLWSDVLAIVAASLLLSFLATLYPAWRAARIAPAEVLRYE